MRLLSNALSFLPRMSKHPGIGKKKFNKRRARAGVGRLSVGSSHRLQRRMVASPFRRERGRARVYSGHIRREPAPAGLGPLTLILSPWSRGEARKATPSVSAHCFQFQEADNGDDFGRGNDVPLAACIECSRPCRWGIATDSYSARDHAFMIKTHPAPLTLGVGSSI